MHNFKGAIFDMDGTLLDSMPVWKRLTQGYLAQFGVHITDQDYAVTEGFSQPQVAQYFADRYPDLPVDAQGIMDGMDELIFVVSKMDDGKRSRYSMALPGLPRRPARATRLKLHLEYESPRRCRIRVEDLGFGELFPSSGKIWQETMEE